MLVDAIKICGVTDPTIAYQAAVAGADYIGLLFSKVSPRQVTLEHARVIANEARRGGAAVVLVLVDETLTQIEAIVAATQATILQLHGEAVRALCPELAKRYTIVYVDNGQSLPECLNVYKDFG